MFNIEKKAYLKLCESMDSPVSLSCWMLATYNEWDQLAEKSIDPLSYNELSSFADDYLVVSVLRKNQRMPTTFDRKEVAYAKFFDSERACAETNERLSGFVDGTISVSPDISSAISHAQRIIGQILGPLTRSKLDFAESNFRFGPGASTAVSGRDVTPSRKFTSSLHVTPRLYPYWHCLVPRLWREAAPDVALRGASKVTCVPKDSKTDRIIAIEPHLNIYVQLGFGALIRRQLKRFGLDLDDQTRNQKLAQSAVRQHLATIDLSSASDTVSRELVWLLLPFEWAAALDLSRTEYAEVKGVEHRLEKFSSMGNGYTFELETLIFYSLALAVSQERAGVSAYGDDIILPAADAPVLIKALDFLGFSVNARKTFLAGRFFESCGKDFFDGANVRPFFWKGEPDWKSQTLFRMANQVRRYAHQRLNGLGCDKRLLSVWLYLFSEMEPSDRRIRIPDGFGDGGLVSNFDESTPQKVGHSTFRTVGHVSWEGYVVNCYVSARQVRRAEPLGLLLTQLVALPSSSTGGRESVRGYQRYCKHPLLFPQWASLGAWI